MALDPIQNSLDPASNDFSKITAGGVDVFVAGTEVYCPSSTAKFKTRQQPGWVDGHLRLSGMLLYFRE